MKTLFILIDARTDFHFPHFLAGGKMLLIDHLDHLPFVICQRNEINPQDLRDGIGRFRNWQVCNIPSCKVSAVINGAILSRFLPKQSIAGNEDSSPSYPFITLAERVPRQMVSVH
jgi:hypothetical protein